MGLRLAAPRATLRLAFPVPDLRGPGARRSWAQRAVRPESLRLELSDLALRSELHAAPSAPPAPAHIEASFSDLHGELGAGVRDPGVQALGLHPLSELERTRASGLLL